MAVSPATLNGFDDAVQVRCWRWIRLRQIIALGQEPPLARFDAPSNQTVDNPRVTLFKENDIPQLERADVRLTRNNQVTWR